MIYKNMHRLCKMYTLLYTCRAEMCWRIKKQNRPHKQTSKTKYMTKITGIKTLHITD